MTELKRATSVSELIDRYVNFKTLDGQSHGLAYKPEPTDIFIVTPSKCGTTWMQQIVHGLRTRGSMDFDEITRVIPWIDMAFDMGIDIYQPQVAKPRAFKTHSTLEVLPKGGKYIFVVRDPKDALLSHYHFFEEWSFEKGSISIMDFARQFYIPKRAIWNHILAFWEVRSDEHILPLCYENIKTNLPQAIERVAQFMNIPLDLELKEIVIRQSDIKFMLEHGAQFDDHLVRDTRNAAMGLPPGGNTSKVRNGQVGESKKDMPEEIKAELDTIWREEITARIGLTSYEELQRELVI